MELHAERWRHRELEAQEDHCLDMGVYFRDEVLLMLRAAGFEDIEVHGEHKRRAATAIRRCLCLCLCLWRRG